MHTISRLNAYDCELNVIIALFLNLLLHGKIHQLCLVVEKFNAVYIYVYNILYVCVSS